MNARITAIYRLRVNSDGNGVRTVVFFHGCPLNCIWCCNPETRYGNHYETVTLSQLYSIIDGDYIYHNATGGGVTFSGGEPLVHAPFIQAYLIAHKGNISSAIETSLYASFDKVSALVPYIDHWYIDLKNMDNAKHLQQTGVTNQTIMANFRRLCCEIDQKKITIAYPFIPTQNDSLDNINEMIQFMHENGLGKVRIIPHRKFTEKKYECMKVSYQSLPAVDGRILAKVIDHFTNNGIQVIQPYGPVGKEKCEYLKTIRRSYCAEHSISLEIPACSFKGKCPGTCPQCEQELKTINNERMN